MGLRKFFFNALFLLCFLVPKLSGKITDREKAICLRVKKIREQIKWSQSEFSNEIGITRDKLASIEYGRTPLRYLVALKICKIFDIQPIWLATGRGTMRPYSHILWTFEQRQKLDESGLLSEVYDFAPGMFLPWLKEGPVNPELIPRDFDFEKSIASNVHFRAQTTRFRDHISAWKFACAVNSFVTQELKRWRAKGLAVRVEEQEMSHPKAEYHVSKKVIDDVSTYGNNEAVKARLPELLMRLKTATQERGKKAALARFLKVPLPKVSQWLSGIHAPGGETALQLLHWVEQEERQK